MRGTSNSKVWIATILASSFVALGLGAGVAAAKSYRAEVYRSEIRPLDDGSIRVTEDIRFRFEGGAFHYAYRILPLRRTDGIDEIASPDPISIHTRKSQVDVRWNFASTRDTVRTFHLSYRVHGAVYRKNGTGALRWLAFPREHEYRIESAQVLLVFASSSPPTEIGTVPRGIPQTRTAAGVVLDVGKLRANRTVRIDATLPGPAIEPHWQALEEKWRRSAPSFLAAAALILAAGIALIIGTWRRYVVSSSMASAGEPPAVAPPSDLPPAIAGALRDGRAGFAQAIGTLLDLAGRGFLRFEETRKNPFLRYGRRVIRRMGDPESPSPWERVILDETFRDADADGVVPLGRAWKRIYRALPSFRRVVEGDLERRGEFDPAIRAGVRRLYGIAVGWGIFAGIMIAATIALYGRFGPAPVAIAFAFGIVAIIAMIAGGAMPLHSSRGKDAALRWKGFASHMKRSAREKTPVETDRFRAWLAYAAAFGLADVWLRAGSRWGIAVPDWLRGAPGSHAAFDGWIPIFGSHGIGGAPGGAGGAAGGGASGAG